jgi:hypothetical protein
MFDPRETNRLALQTVTPTDDRKLAYIKAMRSEDVGFLSAEAPLLVAGYQVFVVCAEDGTPMLLADSHESATAIANSREIETVSLH